MHGSGPYRKVTFRRDSNISDIKHKIWTTGSPTIIRVEELLLNAMNYGTKWESIQFASSCGIWKEIVIEIELIDENMGKDLIATTLSFPEESRRSKLAMISSPLLSALL